MSEICPYTETCIIYKNWAKSQKNKWIDVIDLGIEDCYECSARANLMNKFEKISDFPDEIWERLSIVYSPCSHITLLNLLNKKND